MLKNSASLLNILQGVNEAGKKTPIESSWGKQKQKSTV